jgi:hypothetical protein
MRERRVPLLACPAVAAYNVAMTLVPPHRKRVTHFNEPGHYYELTFWCFQRLTSLRAGRKNKKQKAKVKKK